MKIIAVILVLSALSVARAFTENFDLETGPALPQGWTTTSSNWAVKGGALWKTGKGERQFAVHEGSPVASNFVFESNIMVRRRESDGWSVAGISVFNDVSNLWHFALVEAPSNLGSKHYVELLETYAGVRHAQSTNATRLVCAVREGNQFAWEYNKSYRLRIELGGGRIEGTLFEADGTRRARIAYLIENRPAVTAGRPAAVVSHVVTVFDDLKAVVPGSK